MGHSRLDGSCVGLFTLCDGSQSFELKNSKKIGFTVSNSY